MSVIERRSSMLAESYSKHGNDFKTYVRIGSTPLGPYDGLFPCQDPIFRSFAPLRSPRLPINLRDEHRGGPNSKGGFR